MKKSTIALGLVVLIGIVFRLIWVGDMEYKSDEEYMFRQLMEVGVTTPWPWLGISSGVHIRNPGMSVWIFLALGKFSGASTPTELCRAVQVLNVLALLLALYFTRRYVQRDEQESWYWGIALVSVNPIAVMYHRKIWAQSVLPFFSMLFLMAWWNRKTKWGGFFWGLVGACLGQIHMSGFFFALGFVIWSALFDRRETRWRAWFLGSVLGSLTLLPWIYHVIFEPTGKKAVYGWEMLTQLRYFVFWITDPLGLHLGKTLGVHKGNSTWVQLQDFLSYPAMAPLHVGLLLVTAWILIELGLSLKRYRWKDIFSRSTDSTAFAIQSAVWGYGLLITAATVLVYRFYLLITFPLQFVWISRLCLGFSMYRGRILLVLLVLLQCGITAGFLKYIHDNGGAVQGDYGPAYRVQ